MFAFKHSAVALFVFFIFMPAHAEDLLDVLSFVNNNDPRILAQSSRSSAVNELRAQARARSLPQINLSAGFEENRIDNASLFDDSDGVQERSFDFQTRGVGVTGSLEVFSGFKNRNNRKRAASLSEGADLELELVRQTALREAAVAYFDVLRDIKLYEVRLRNLKVLEFERQRAEDERALGAATTTDVAQTEVRLARARARLAGASSDLAESRAEFVKQVGREPIDLEPVSTLVVIPPSLDDAMAIADRNEPRTGIAKKRAAAAEYDVKIARAEFAPKVAVGVSYQLADNPSFFVQNSDSLVYGARLSVPVFSGGLNRSRLKEAKARLRAVRQDAVFTERETHSEIAKAWARVIAADVARQSAEKEVIAAGMALAGVREEQNLGLRTTLDVLDAEQEKLNAEAFLAESERERNAAAVTLLSYIGALTASGEESAWASFNTENLRDGADQ